MTPLERLRAEQHNDRLVDSEVELEKFLRRTPLQQALTDLEPTTAIERDHLARARSAA